MADSIRTLEDLLALAPVGVAGAISAQDLRDMLVSLANAYQQQGTRGWKDLVSPFSAAKTTTQASPTWEVWLGGLWAYSFSASAMNELMLAPFHINHDYAEGTAIYPHIHWMPSTTGSGTVRWGIEYTWAQGHNQMAFATPQTIYIEQAAHGIVNRHMVAEVADPGISLTGLETDSLLLVRVFRDAAHANDTYAAKAWGTMLDFHYQADRVASKNRAPDFNV